MDNETRLHLIKSNVILPKKNGQVRNLYNKDFDFLVEQAETLQKIANRWIEIETNGTYEEANDFYSFVQDTLSPKQLD